MSQPRKRPGYIRELIKDCIGAIALFALVIIGLWVF